MRACVECVRSCTLCVCVCVCVLDVWDGQEGKMLRTHSLLPFGASLWKVVRDNVFEKQLGVEVAASGAKGGSEANVEQRQVRGGKQGPAQDAQGNGDWQHKALRDDKGGHVQHQHRRVVFVPILEQHPGQ